MQKLMIILKIIMLTILYITVMIFLQLHNHKQTFNNSLLALRDKKIQVIEDVKALVEQLEKVQSKLRADKTLPLPEIPQLYPEEVPEKSASFYKINIWIE